MSPPAPSVLGFDTETFQGWVKCLAFSDGTFVESCDTDTLLDALYRVGRGVSYLVAWNLSFDSAAIIKSWVVAHQKQFRSAHYRLIRARRRERELLLKDQENGRLSAEESRELQQLRAEIDGEEAVERFTTRRYCVTLIGSKAMGINPRKNRKHRHGGVWIFDAAAFYSSSFGGMSLDKAARKYLGRHKSTEEEGLDRARIGSEAGYYETHRAAILRYCIEDCRLTAALFELTMNAFLRPGLPFPKRPYSRASVSREYLKQTGVLDPTAKAYAELSRCAARSLWERAFSGGVFLNLAAGRWENPYGIDINSAYPAAMVLFPSLERAFPVTRDDPRFATAFFQFYRIRVRPTPRTPVRAPKTLRKLYGWDDKEVSLCVTGWDLETMRDLGDPYEIEDAVGIVCPSSERPLGYLASLYDRKDRVKSEFGSDSVEYANVKILLNGTYGILAQRRPRTSRYTNLIYAAYVTAFCRRLLWRAVSDTESVGGVVLSLATDGVLIHGESARDLWKSRNSRALGKWSYSPHTEAVLFENGVGFLDGTEVKKRGMPSLTRAVLEACETPYWEEVREKPVKLRSAIIQRRAHAIGSFESTSRILCPVKSYADAQLVVPPDLQGAPLSAFFRRSWRLALRGGGDGRPLTLYTFGAYGPLRAIANEENENERKQV